MVLFLLCELASELEPSEQNLGSPAAAWRTTGRRRSVFLVDAKDISQNGKTKGGIKSGYSGSSA